MRQAHDNIQVTVIKTSYRVSAKGNEHRRHGAEEEYAPLGGIFMRTQLLGWMKLL